MPKHIGIVAVSPEGAALCYRDIFRIARRLVGDRGHPQVSLHNLPVAEYVDAVLQNDWHRVAGLLTRSAKVLAAAGADFCILPDNLMQHAVHLVEHASPIPWLTMTEPVARAVVRDQRTTVGLIGTKLVMLGSTYQTHLGLRRVQVLVPASADADELDAIIFRELLFGEVRPESQRRVLAIVKTLADQGCQGVILGCTEAPLVVTDENSPIPVYDAAELLAQAAVEHALGLTDRLPPR